MCYMFALEFVDAFVILCLCCHTELFLAASFIEYPAVVYPCWPFHRYCETCSNVI